jgi:DedD protein
MGVFSRKKDQTESFPQSPAARRTRTAGRDDRGRDDLDTDPLELDRRRARRRLVGAIALAIGAVVFLPMIFDSEPKGSNDPLSVQMPDKDTPFTPILPPAGGTVATPAADGANASGANPAISSTPSSGALVSGSAPAPLAPAPSAPSAEAPAASQTKLRAPASSSPAGNASPESDSATRAAPKAAEKDDPRALAALEGKVLDPTPNRAQAGSSGTGGNYAVQIGAFSSSEKVKELREKLAAAGLKTYTETLNTAQGERTRVRVGPYPSHEAAEKARERVKGVGLDGAVIPL